MTGFAVDPAILQASLENTAEKARSLSDLLFAKGGGLSSSFGEQCVDLLAGSTGLDGVVMESVEGLLEEQLGGRVQSAMSQYSTALESTALAANAILAGADQQAIDIATSMSGSGFGSAGLAGMEK